MNRGVEREVAAAAGPPSEGYLPSPPRTPDLQPSRRRRTQYGVRGAQLAMAMLVAVAVVTTMSTRAGQLSGARLVLLAAAGSAYVVWTLYVTREAARFALSNHPLDAAQAWPSPGGVRATLQLAVQMGLAELIVWLAAPAGVLGLLWLVLLPPVGFAVMYLRPAAITVVSVLTLAIHGVNVAHWHGREPLAVAVPGFAMAVLFTLVFTQIAVSAERARGEVERLAGALGLANDKLREHAVQAEELAATRERNRVAREIHDGLGHCLTVVHVQLEVARSALGPDAARAAQAVDKAQSMNHLALQEVRRSVATLRSSPLEGRPLSDLLLQVVADNQAAGLNATLGVIGDPRTLPPPASLALYRAAQEGLTNARRHGRPNSARVQVDYRPAGRVRLTVADDGAGAADAQEGFGLLGLRERAELVGGTMAVRTAPGGGFAIEIEVPG